MFELSGRLRPWKRSGGNGPRRYDVAQLGVRPTPAEAEEPTTAEICQAFIAGELEQAWIEEADVDSKWSVIISTLDLAASATLGHSKR